MKSEAKNNLKKNLISLYVIQCINYISPYIILFLAVKTLKIEDYGYIAICSGLTQFLASVLDLGYNLYITNIVAKNKHKEKKLLIILVNAFAIKIIISCVFIVMMLMAVSIINFTLSALSISIVTITAVLISAQPVWYFQGIEKMKLVLIATGVAKFISVLMVIGWALYIKEPNYLLIIETISAGVLLVLLMFIISKNIQLSVKNIIKAKRMKIILFESMKFYFPRLAAAVYTTTGTTLVGMAGDLKLVATYSIAERLYAAIQQCFFPAVQALYPYLSSNKDLNTFIKWSKLLVALALVAAIILFSIGDKLAILAFPTAGEPDGSVIKIFSLAIIVYVCNILMGYPFSAMLGSLNVANKSIYLGAVAYGVAAFVLINAGGVTPISVAVIYLMAEITVCIFRIVKNYERYKKEVL